MRTLKRNQHPFYIAPFVEKRSVLREDEWGNVIDTGEIEAVYGPPTPLAGNVSAAKGDAQVRQFGVDISYDKVIVLTDPKIPIDEFSVLWVDTMPVLDAEGKTETPYDYVVRRVARSLNSISIAISKVSVSK